MRIIDADELLTDPYFQDESIPDRVMFIEAVNNCPTISTSWVHDVVKVQEEYQNLIDRKQLTKKAMCDLCIPLRDKYNLSDRQTLSVVRNEISLSEMVDLLDPPTIDPFVKRGRWEIGKVEPGYFTPGGNSPWICSECGYLASCMLEKPEYNFCPHCGTLMED